MNVEDVGRNMIELEKQWFEASRMAMSLERELAASGWRRSRSVAETREQLAKLTARKQAIMRKIEELENSLLD